MTRRRIVIAAALGLIVVVAAVVVLTRAPAAPDASPTVQQPGEEPRPVELRFRWPAGTWLRYDLDLTADNTTVFVRAPDDLPAGQEVRGEMGAVVRLDGDVLLRSYEVRGDATVLGLSFTALRRHEIRVMGQALLPDAASVLGHEALVLVGALGEVRHVAFRDDAPYLFRNLVQLVLGETQVRLAGGGLGSWTVPERTQHGTAPTRYDVAHPGPEGTTLEKSRNDYDELQALAHHPDGARHTASAHGKVRVHRDGYLQWLFLEETVRASDASGAPLLDATGTVRFALVEAGRFDLATRPDPDTFTVSYDQGEPAVDEALAERQHREQRIAGLTPEQLLDTLTAHARAGSVPDHNRFLWRATALLREHPELCEDLRRMIVDPTMSSNGRALLLDLLVGAGTPAAQAALRAALSTGSVQEDRYYGLLYQRFALVKHPDEQTLAQLADQYEQPGPEGARAATMALGAAAGQLREHGEAERGGPVAERLKEDLAEADDPAVQEALVAALGNAGFPAHAELLAAYHDSGSVDVRMATAAALRKMKDPESRSTLVTMATDADVMVQRQALRTLARQDLSHEDLERLLERVRDMRVNERTYHELVTVLTPYLERDELAERILRLMLTQELEDDRVKGRIRALLQR